MECVILAFQVKSVGENGFGGMRVCLASVGSPWSNGLGGTPYTILLI